MPQTEVELAFAAGWQLAELRHAPGHEPHPTKLPVCLPQIHDLGPGTRVPILKRQLCRGLAALPGNHGRPVRRIRRLGLDRLDQLDDIHVDLLTSLTAHDFQLGKAYAIGVELAETVLLTYTALKRPSGPDRDTVERLWNEGRTKLVIGRLRDLKTQFQPYSVDATTATLEDWLATFEKWSRWDADRLQQMADKRLYPQGAAWRALLSGEKKATDFLQVSEYVVAIGNLVRDYVSFTWRFLRSSPVLTGMLLAALVAGGYYILHNPKEVQTVVLGLLGLFSLSTATIIATVRRALATAERHLWYAELAHAVALAVGYVPVRMHHSRVRRLGQLVAHDRWLVKHR